MTHMTDMTSRYALIAGGSKGIGYAIAHALAKRGYNLLLVARDPVALGRTKESLESTFNIIVDVLARDLSLDGTPEEVAEWCKKKGIALKMFCYVAGMGGSKDFLSLPLNGLRTMARLNVDAGIVLCHELIPLLEKNAPSYIMNVGSMAGFAPIPSKNLYAATQAAVLYFSYSLRYQLKKKNISVSCLCPGPVFTKPEIIETTKQKLGRFGKWMAVDPARVGEIAVRRTLRKRFLIIPGLLAKLVSVILRIFPARWIAAIYSRGGG